MDAHNGVRLVERREIDVDVSLSMARKAVLFGRKDEVRLDCTTIWKRGSGEAGCRSCPKPNSTTRLDWDVSEEC